MADMVKQCTTVSVATYCCPWPLNRTILDFSGKVFCTTVHGCALATQQVLQGLQWEMEHPAYSPDLAPSG